MQGREQGRDRHHRDQRQRRLSGDRSGLVERCQKT
jgi:hypothetical protein